MSFESCEDCRTVADYKKRCYSNGFYAGVKEQKKKQHDQIKTELFYRERKGYENGINDMANLIIKKLLESELTIEDVQKISYQLWIR